MTCKKDTPIAAVNAIRAALCQREILAEGTYAAFAKRANVLFGFQDLNTQKFLRQGTIALHRGAEVEVTACISAISILQRVVQPSVFYTMWFSSQYFTARVSAVSILQCVFQQSVFYSVCFRCQSFTMCISAASFLQFGIQQSAVHRAWFNSKYFIARGSKVNVLQRSIQQSVFCSVRVTAVSILQCVF